MRTWIGVGTGLILLGVGATATGCVALLGDFDTDAVATNPDGGGVADVGPQADTSANADTGASAVGCTKLEDCLSTPAGCAVATCESGTCNYKVLDADNDGHPRDGCLNAKGEPLPGDDCEDGDKFIYPGAACVPGSAGSGPQPPPAKPFVGECKNGSIKCTDKKAVCTDAVLPEANEVCAPGGGGNNKDENCDGNKDEGCGCTPGESRTCGPPQAGVGNCKSGTQTCSVDAKWPTKCTDAVYPLPRDCGVQNQFDNDCNGTLDYKETNFCKCEIGVVQACTVPGGKGICAPGTQSCKDLGNGLSDFGTCVSNSAPQTELCTNGLDDDCDGNVDAADKNCWVVENICVKAGNCMSSSNPTPAGTNPYDSIFIGPGGCDGTAGYTSLGSFNLLTNNIAGVTTAITRCVGGSGSTYQVTTGSCLSGYTAQATLGYAWTAPPAGIPNESLSSAQDFDTIVNTGVNRPLMPTTLINACAGATVSQSISAYAPK